jgi:ribosomal protein S3AE
MNIENMPLIKVEIDFVRMGIQRLIKDHNEHLNERISEAVDKAIAEYDIDRVVRRIIEDRIEHELQAYFTYGDGSKAIRDTIAQAFKKEEV